MYGYEYRVSNFEVTDVLQIVIVTLFCSGCCGCCGGIGGSSSGMVCGKNLLVEYTVCLHQIDMPFCIIFVLLDL
jgi:hypothetical protein